MQVLKRYSRDFVNLFYPRICASCNNVLATNEQELCLNCLFEVHKTDYDSFVSNEIADIFDGRIRIKYAFANYYYHKGGILQELIHKLKYRGQKELGACLGRQVGLRMKNTELAKADYLIPVPLFSKKQKKRGYNQAEWIAKGIQEALGIEMCTNNLYRKINTDTQTRKNRIQRWENVGNVFEVKNPPKYTGKHILLIDDIVTTGSTLEACMLALNKAENIEISVVCLAKAD